MQPPQPHPSPAAPAPAPTPRRPRALWKWIVGFLVLAWAWQISGMHESWKLWANRERAAEYLLGRELADVDLADRRAEATRDIRTEFQTAARRRIEDTLRQEGRPVPGLMTLMQDAERQAAADIEALGPGGLDRLVDQRLAEQGVQGGRRGGFWPPETAPRAIFGDPDRLGRLHWSVAWIVDLADAVGGYARASVRWTIAAFAGNGYTGELFETIAIAIWGTLLAVLLAVPAAILGATRTLELIVPGNSPAHRVVRWFGKFVVRRSFDVTRGFNEIVLALILVAVLGLGPLPGVLALFIHTFGVLGKVFADAIEVADPRPMEGVQATGAAWSQTIAFAVVPQILPYVASQSLLRFESNVRGATILGVVGAGGIGQLLMDKFGAFEFDEVATMMLIIIVVVTLIDSACGRVMRRLH